MSGRYRVPTSKVWFLQDPMTDVLALAQKIQLESRALDQVRQALHQVIVGQEELIDGPLIAMLAGAGRMRILRFSVSVAVATVAAEAMAAAQTASLRNAGRHRR